MAPLKILFIASEIAPLVKTGGLADVAQALPKTLHGMGHDIRLAMPGYGAISLEDRGKHTCTCDAHLAGRRLTGAMRTTTLPKTSVPLYLIEHDEFFNRHGIYSSGGEEYEDNLLRFSFFCLAVLDGIRHIGWKPDVVHCNDWHTAGIPAHIKTTFAHDPFWEQTPTVYTIHNLAYQGRYPAWKLPETGLGWELFTPDCLEFYGDMNLMKAAIRFASQISTVSERYAREIQTAEYGHGLEGFLRTRADDLSGILNGVDYSEWHPETYPEIAANYSADDLSGKQKCKEALQDAFNLPHRDVPLFGMVARFDWQKGLDLVADSMAELLKEDAQFVFLGTGDRRFESLFAELGRENPDKFSVQLKYDGVLAHQIHAGADFFLMPSHFEPSGLSQLYGLAFGSIPVVRKTGGLADSIKDATRVNLERGQATGIVFGPRTAHAFTEAIMRAIRLYSDKDTLHQLMKTGMRQDFSWHRAAEKYLTLYDRAIANP
jgi:starch synthase